MLVVVEALKIFALPFKRRIAWEPLATEKLFVVCVVEFLYYPVPPWFTYWDKYWLNTEMEAKPDNQPKGSGVFIATAKTQLVVQL